jgi:hypothetical protein
MSAHCGLIFTDDHIQRARRQRAEPPMNLAWALLDERKPEPGLDALLWAGLRYRIQADAEAGEQGAALLLEGRNDLSMPTDETQADVDALKSTFTLAQAFELFRAHPRVEAGAERWLNHFREGVLAFPMPGEDTLAVPHLWWGVVQMAGGVVLEDDTLMDAGVTVARQIIDAEVHPEGYLRRDVKVDPEAQSLVNQLDAVLALTLIAEMAEHVGRAVWQYANRGVTITTATTYPLYYYYYAEEWRWNGSEYRPSEGIDAETAQAAFRQRAGFLEIVSQQYDKPLKAINLILDELRPIYDLHGGGLVTLTHGPVERKRWRLFS